MYIHGYSKYTHTHIYMHIYIHVSVYVGIHAQIYAYKFCSTPIYLPLEVLNY